MTGRRELEPAMANREGHGRDPLAAGTRLAVRALKARREEEPETSPEELVEAAVEDLEAFLEEVSG